MDDVEIRLLERRVDELLHSLDRLREENRSLRENNTALLAERARLTERNEEARVRVEAMIARLRNMEAQP